MSKLSLISQSPEQTRRLGYQLGCLAQGNDIYLLTGNLGTGKTCFIQGLAFGLDIREYACSPSFMIAREYHGRLNLYHLDLYRLDHIDEIIDLGIDEYFYHNAVCAIEWAEKGFQVLPEDNLTILLEHMQENQRGITFNPKGQRYFELVQELKDRLTQDNVEKWNLL